MTDIQAHLPQLHWLADTTNVTQRIDVCLRPLNSILVLQVGRCISACPVLHLPHLSLHPQVEGHRPLAVWFNLTELLGNGTATGGSYNSSTGIAAMVINQPSHALIIVFQSHVNVTHISLQLDSETVLNGTKAKASHSVLMSFDTLPIPSTTTAATPLAVRLEIGLSLQFCGGEKALAPF